MDRKPFRTKMPLIINNREAALEAGHIIHEPRIYGSEYGFMTDKMLRAYDAFLVLTREGNFEVHPLIHWGTDIKTIGAHPSYDMTTQEY